MCGIWTFINLLKTNIEYKTLYENFMKLQHRGPDSSNFQIFKNIAIGFHRLSIMDLKFHANQPYIFEDLYRTIIFTCNGEIYNFKDLIKEHDLLITNNSDCMVIPKLYLKYTFDIFLSLFINKIKGEFAFTLLEFDNFQNLKNVIVGRDQIGIRPLFWSKKNNLLFSSEIKGMDFIKEQIEEFPPGTITNIIIDDILKDTNVINNYEFKTVYLTKPILTDYDYLYQIRIAVINSIKRRLVSDTPIAFLLSGGVDSSLVAAIASKILNYPIKTYCCGLNEGTDLKFSRKVAEHIGSIHTEVFFTESEGIDAINDVIYTTETWDTTTIRASVGQYLVSKYIATKTDAKVILVGEGPDEVCSSYLFNYYAPSAEDLHNVAKEYVEKIHMYDGRRADRCVSSWGLEARVPLLDPEFISTYWSIPSVKRHPKYKNIEKWWLRQAFEGTGLLPDEVLWRKKEAFSDGISSNEKSWFQIIHDYINKQLPDESQDYKPTKEAYYYKQKFIEYFGENNLNIIPHYWQPPKGWINNDEYTDPSARTLNVY